MNVMNSILTEIVEKTTNLTLAERNTLILHLQNHSSEAESNGKSSFRLHPNTVCVKENHAKYPGNYVALKDGEFIASGKTIKEANEKARSLGVDNPFLHRIFDEGELPFGG